MREVEIIKNVIRCYDLTDDGTERVMSAEEILKLMEIGGDFSGGKLRIETIRRVVKYGAAPEGCR